MKHSGGGMGGVLARRLSYGHNRREAKPQSPPYYNVLRHAPLPMLTNLKTRTALCAEKPRNALLLSSFLRKQEWRERSDRIAKLTNSANIFYLALQELP